MLGHEMSTTYHKHASICPAGRPIIDEYTRRCFLTKVNNVRYKGHTFLNVSTEFSEMCMKGTHTEILSELYCIGNDDFEIFHKHFSSNIFHRNFYTISP